MSSRNMLPKISSTKSMRSLSKHKSVARNVAKNKARIFEMKKRMLGSPITQNHGVSSKVVDLSKSSSSPSPLVKTSEKGRFVS